LESDPSARLSIVIPAYNEAKRLPATLNRLHEYLTCQAYDYEIVVVSNGSTDDTVAVVVEAQVEVPGLRLIVLTERGKGLAARTGALQNEGGIVFICDADLSMPPENIQRFLDALKFADLVVGSREAPGATRYSEPWQRHVMGRVFNRLVQLLAVPGIEDTQCGFKAFRRAVARDLFGQQSVTGWGFDVELLFLARKYGYVVHELGIDWHYDADSRVRPVHDTLSMFVEIVKIRLRDAVGGYHNKSEAAPAGERSVR